MKLIDLRSDTVTRPTPAMREAMANAAVGDDVFADDPTIIELENLAAQTLGKEAALFVPSGTMGNQVSVMTHTHPGDEMIAGAFCHIMNNELGGAARLSGVGCAQIDNPDAKIYPEDVRRRFRPSGKINYPQSTLLCLENTLGTGDVIELDLMAETSKTAKELGLAVHLDGARLFNAATALGVEAREIARYADSVMFCISKGLCSPVGSLVCGNRDFITKARKNRKLLGGGMRQAGVLAACGLISIKEMTQRLHIDHENAKLLGEGLSDIPAVKVKLDKLKTNMVFWSTDAVGFSSADFVDYLKKNDIISEKDNAGVFRFVTHNDVSREDVERVVSVVGEYFS